MSSSVVTCNQMHSREGKRFPRMMVKAGLRTTAGQAYKQEKKEFQEE